LESDGAASAGAADDEAVAVEAGAVAVGVAGTVAGRATLGFCGAVGITSGARWPQAIKLPDRIKTSNARIIPTSRSSLA
jgi:hypothetical protein